MYHDQNRRRNGDEPAAPGDVHPDAPGAPDGTGASDGPGGPEQPTPGGFDPERLSGRLRSRVLGQEPAVAAVVRAVVLATAGATDPQRPLANLLLVGPTGVGKTELVRQVAAELRSGPDDLCRVDMNSLAQEHYAASFTGAPPGYAGSKEAFTVFDRTTVEGDPYRPGIVLFDEVEKAHPTVLRALLHVLDNGTLRLANGQQTISFRNSFVFLTSNLGSAELARRRDARWRRAADRLGARSGALTARLAAKGNKDVLTAALRGFFDTEFLNRIDETAVFTELDTATAERIAALEIELLRQRLSRRSVRLDADASVTALLAERGFDPVYGARGLRRTVRTVLAAPVADAVLRVRPSGGEPVHLRVRAGADGEMRVTPQDTPDGTAGREAPDATEGREAPDREGARDRAEATDA
ncbi:ATP-dependent Clp protease ATP-binding subunit [Streptomyces armeniacus]|uniref:ATP-dependent Clp protease ATP-binding subunit n=2 Tax=Streptomyces armeniacus TaxID=83291 RepID=A0A345Y1A9_9ACTN|nr:ATP-dependent Clp protease ATP-binding subunit [Streptomyces armeniacus]